MTIFHLVSTITFTLTVFPRAWTSITVRPNNVAVQANQSTSLNCSTTSNGGVKWLRDGVTVCAGLGCFDPYIQRFHVENIPSTRSWNLIISFVKAEDAGEYICEEIGFASDKGSVQLTVLETEDEETTHGKSTIGLPHITTVSDRAATSTAIVANAGGTISGGAIAAIIISIFGVLIIIIIVYVVRKRRHRARSRNIERNGHQQPIGEPANAHELQQLISSTSSEQQQLMSVPTMSNDQQLMSVPSTSNDQQLMSVPSTSNEQRLMSVPTTSNEQRLMSVPTTSNEQQLMGDVVYIDQPTLVKTIKTSSAVEKNSSIRAVAVFNQEVFIATDNCPEIEVYDVVNIDLKRRFTIKQLINPLDIKPCLKNNCLYIFDCVFVGGPGKMLKIVHDSCILEWPMEDSGARLSVAGNGNIIVSLWTSNKIVEYKSDGRKVREIKLHAPRHAILLENEQILISQGHADDEELHRVFQLQLEDSVSNVTADQHDVRIIKAVGGERGQGADQMNVPWYMAVDENGFILVAERENQRVTLFSPTLEFKKTLISEADGLRRPLNMFMDVQSGRLFVTDFIWEGTKRVDGQLLVFKIRNPTNPQDYKL